MMNQSVLFSLFGGLKCTVKQIFTFIFVDTVLEQIPPFYDVQMESWLQRLFKRFSRNR